MIRGFTIIVLIIFIAAGAAIALSYFDRETEPGAVELAEDMRARACSGNIEGFFSYFDNQSLESSLKRTELMRTRSEYLYSTKKKPKGDEGIRDYIDLSVPDLITYKLKVYEDQVKAGKTGPICNMEIVRVGSPGKNVKLKFPGGERTTWGFGRVGKDWKLVSITDVKPISLASARAYKKKEAKRKKKAEKISAEQDPRELAKALGSKSSEKLDERPVESNITAGAKDMKTQDLGSTEMRLSEKPLDVSVSRDKPTPTQASKSEYVRDFRNTRWGMTEAEVRKSEMEDPQGSSPEGLNYGAYYRGEIVDLNYKFSDGGLKSAGIRFLNERPEEIFYVQDFEKRKAELTAFYGAPVLDEEIWYNRVYEGEPEKIGFAVAIGHLRLRTKWRTERTEIVLELKSEDYDMTLLQSYHAR